MTVRDVSLTEANAHLATVEFPGDVVYLVRRGLSRRHNLIVDLAVWPSSKKHHLADAHCLGRFVAPIVGRPYLFDYQGILLKRGEAGETLVEQLSRHLFGKPTQLKAVWL